MQYCKSFRHFVPESQVGQTAAAEGANVRPGVKLGDNQLDGHLGCAILEGRECHHYLGDPSGGDNSCRKHTYTDTHT